jgi:hypothetical protein
VVDTVLGLIGLVAYIVGTITLAAFVTWAVVKISPSVKNDKPKEPVSAAE